MESWREELYHSGKGIGAERKNHKYISREWKNGRWVYYYELPGGKKQELKTATAVTNLLGLNKKQEMVKAAERAEKRFGKNDNVYADDPTYAKVISAEGRARSVANKSKQTAKSSQNDVNDILKLQRQTGLKNWSTRGKDIKDLTKDASTASRTAKDAERMANDIQKTRSDYYDKTIAGNIEKGKSWVNYFISGLQRRIKKG